MPADGRWDLTSVFKGLMKYGKIIDISALFMPAFICFGFNPASFSMDIGG